ncbi:MAG: retropepsin-like domain-containing protein [Marinilabiliaceae bacterium]|nr:retropepsin-like domain-containing protein [Marinilabiliaceae bacterium]
MTTIPFDRKEPLVMIPVTIKKGNEILRYEFAVDTGSTITLFDSDVLRELGYNPSYSIGTTYTVTASKTETVHEYSLDNIMALGLIRRNFKVISRELPIGLGIDGLLGLNFFKHKELTIDFKRGEIRIQ